MDHNHSEDQDGEMRSTEPGNPHNDQMLARVRMELRMLLDNTIHPLIDQAEAQDVDLSSMMAVLAPSLIEREDWMPRSRLASLLALLLFETAARERVAVSQDIEKLIKSVSGDASDPV